LRSERSNPNIHIHTLSLSLNPKFFLSPSPRSPLRHTEIEIEIEINPNTYSHTLFRLGFRFGFKWLRPVPLPIILLSLESPRPGVRLWLQLHLLPLRRCLSTLPWSILPQRMMSITAVETMSIAGRGLRGISPPTVLLLPSWVQIPGPHCRNPLALRQNHLHLRNLRRVPWMRCLRHHCRFFFIPSFVFVNLGLLI